MYNFYQLVLIIPMDMTTQITMEKKQMYAIAVVAILIIAGIAVALVLTKDKSGGGDDREPYVGLALTNDLFSGHTCCIIGARAGYLDGNSDTVKAFLDAYSDAVVEISMALKDKSSQNYTKLIDVAKNRVAMPDSLTDDQKKAAIESALGNVTYLYADDIDGEMTELVSDVASLAESLYNGKQIEKSAADLGFDSYEDLAEAFVDDSYMMDAVTEQYVKPEKKVTIKIAAIEGDIHQIAMWYAKDTGIFGNYNIDITVSGQAGGPGVYTALNSADCDIGFLGAPPMTIRSMNNADITSESAKLKIIGRVNSEGSGILLKPGEVASDYITVTTTAPGLGAKYIYNEETEKYYVFNVEKWGGQIIATPGAATIQHVQLSQLASMMGLKFESYITGMSRSSDTLYYVAGVSSFANFVNTRATSPEIVGYIIWEAQYSIGLQ